MSDPYTGPNDATLRLLAETMTVDKRRLPDQVVRVASQTHTRDVAVQEALAHDGVTIEHVAVGRYVDAVPAMRQEGDITILPVVEEELVITKRLFLREEVHIRRTRTTADHIETVSLREQHIVVTRIPAKLASGEATPSDGGASATRQQIRNAPMPDDTIVAVYDTPAHAELAAQDLKAAGIPDAFISVHTRAHTLPSSTMSGQPHEGFWSKLFGGEADDASVYDHSVAAGSSVVTVKAPDVHLAQISEILESHDPVDIDERAASYRRTTPVPATETMGAASMAGAEPSPAGYATPPAVTPADAGSTIQLAEERLTVGKRLVNRGGTRIRRYVVETPVEESVTLHSETVTLDRRPVTDGQPVTDADFSDKTIEMVETAEELVVSKTAHVVEEVSLHKQASDRVETVHDTVRKQAVEIEQIPATTSAPTLDPRAPHI